MSGKFWESIREGRNDWKRSEVARMSLSRNLTGPNIAAAAAETQ